MICNKNLIYFSALVIIIVAISSSCSKTKAVAFEHSTMKPFFDRNCASCHASGGTAVSSWKYDASNYETSIKNHIASIYHHVYVIQAMPPTGLNASDSTAFITWYNAGYPAK